MSSKNLLKLVIISIVLVLLIMVLSKKAYGACVNSCVSAGSGDWTDPASWGACGGGFPVSGDCARIDAPHTITVDANITVGSAPAGVATYDLDINGGTLEWPSAVAADYTLTVRSSMTVRAGGVFRIGDSAVSPLDCDRKATVYFANTDPVPDQYYQIYLNGGYLKVYGCENFPASSGSVMRARIESCAPDCNAGAGRTIRLDRDVNWNAIGAPDDYNAIIMGTGGNSASAGTNPERISVWTAPAANQIGGVTLTQNHLAGDIVVNASRNVLFSTDSDVYHSVIYTNTGTNDVYDLNWMLTKYFGRGNANTSAIAFNSAANTLGTWKYVSVLDPKFNGFQGSNCFTVLTSGWTALEGLVCYETRINSGIDIGNSATGRTKHTIKDYTYIGGSSGSDGFGLNTSGGFDAHLVIDGYWCSHATSCAYLVSDRFTIDNSVFNSCVGTGGCVSYANPGNYVGRMQLTIKDTELRNTSYYHISGSYTRRLLLYKNDFDNAVRDCVLFTNGYSNGKIVAIENTYDNCNSADSASYSAFNIYGANGTYYGQGESFGTTTANHKSNIMYAPTYSTATNPAYFRGTCNECIMTAPTNAAWALSDVYLYNGTAGYSYAAFIDDDTYFTLHNKNGVEGTHEGWGPGGMYFWRETVTVVDNTLNVGIKPGSAMDYEYFPIGDISVNNGTALSVSLQLRKDEAVPVDRRPRLVLEGCGFNREDDYDEMSDVINTWETVTVAGNANAKGVVHAYIAVQNNLSGVNDYTPVWPPTLEIYADGVSVTK